MPLPPQSPGEERRATRRRLSTPGFRFSALDAGILAALVIASGLLYRLPSPLWWISALVGGHFFLFCNVFRLARVLELVWAFAFLAAVLLFAVSERLSLINVLAFQAPISVGVIVWEIKSPRYHGILAAWVSRDPPPSDGVIGAEAAEHTKETPPPGGNRGR